MKNHIKGLCIAAFSLMAVLFCPTKAHAIANARTYPAYAKETGYFYEQLSQTNKGIYQLYANTIVESGEYSPSRSTMCTKLGGSGSNDDTDILSTEDYCQIKSAYELDHPGLMSNTTKDRTLYPEGIIVDVSRTNAVLNQAHSMVAQLKGTTKSEKATELHDALANLCTYKDTNNDQTSYGALIEHEAVCNGYAHAYQLLCNCAGIEAIVQYGRAPQIPHAWNQIQLQDNEWYEVDVTWDDSNLGHIYRNFLITTARMESYDHVHFWREDELKYIYNTVNGKKVRIGYEYGYYFRLDPPKSYGTALSYVYPDGHTTNETPVSYLQITVDNYELSLGETTIATVTFIPADATMRKLTWTSSDPSIVSIEPYDSDHDLEYEKVKLVAKKGGQVDVTAVSADGRYDASHTVWVNDPNGDNTPADNDFYRQQESLIDNTNNVPNTNANDNDQNNANRSSNIGKTVHTTTNETVVITSENTVKIKKADKKASFVPESVIIDGIKYDVEEIMPGAYKNNRNIKSISIGRKITKIGAKAFYGCKNAKKIKFKGTGSIEIGNRAFDKINRKAVISIKKKVYTVYKSKIIKSKTVKSAKYKKY